MSSTEARTDNSGISAEQAVEQADTASSSRHRDLSAFWWSILLAAAFGAIALSIFSIFNLAVPLKHYTGVTIGLLTLETQYLYAMMALLMPLVDSTVAEAGWDLPEWIHTETDTARSTLSSLLGAMVAVTGTVFSITVVSLSLASQQFGPRLLRRFMYDLPTQVTLGVFLATAFYCLLLLRVVESRRDGVTVPHLSVLVAVIFAVMSMMTLIVFALAIASSSPS